MRFDSKVVWITGASLVSGELVIHYQILGIFTFDFIKCYSEQGSSTSGTKFDQSTCFTL
jgi:hypothetical protein